MSGVMKVRRAVMKLATLKGVVFVGLIQNLIFNILLTQEVIVPDEILTCGDWTYGIPYALLSAEMVLFSAINWYAFSSTEYSSTARRSEQPLPLFSAIIDSMNPIELLLGVVRIFALCVRPKASRLPPFARRGTNYQNLVSDWSGTPPGPYASRAPEGGARERTEYEHEMYTPAPAYSTDDEVRLIPAARDGDLASPPSRR
ncbi:uncharacterized protein LTR77_010905 [Saxophila tyrrhenica]|uniref:Uncharacterized protein n=1 Tax=Saxophila tyrrhenica TaxID=1690608 RepID=A0AAV9NU89_9PEZI|nr:hypothetical protein LTR77_010905 [Saxophila tyrrhenica]